MRQWVAEIAYDSTSGPKKALESFYLPHEEDVRAAVTKKGGYVLSIRPHERSPLASRKFGISSGIRTESNSSTVN